MNAREALYREVGRITVNFSRLDFFLGLLLGGLMRVRFDVGLMITTEQSFRQKVSLLSSFTKLISEAPGGSKSQIGNELQHLLHKLANYEERRNAITHSLWGFSEKELDSDKQFRIKVTAKQKRGLHHGFEQMSNSELSKIGDEFGATADEIMKLFGRITSQAQAGKRPRDSEAPK